MMIDAETAVHLLLGEKNANAGNGLCRPASVKMAAATVFGTSRAMPVSEHVRRLRRGGTETTKEKEGEPLRNGANK